MTTLKLKQKRRGPREGEGEESKSEKVWRQLCLFKIKRHEIKVAIG
jgi:hypothetical protein